MDGSAADRPPRLGEARGGRDCGSATPPEGRLRDEYDNPRRFRLDGLAPAFEAATGTMTLHEPPSYLTVLDATALERLRALDPDGASGLVDRVLGTFKHSLETLMPRLHDGQRSGDAVTVRHVAHTLKSSSSSVGASRLSQLCSAVEAAVRDGRDLGAVARELDELQSESRRLIAVLPALAPRSR